jgi:hypothetical protein
MTRKSWSQADLARLSPSERRRIRQEVGRQRRSPDPLVRAAAKDVIEALDAAEVETIGARVAAAKAFLHPFGR